MQYLSYVIVWMAVPAFGAFVMPPCPSGTEAMTKSEDGANIRYCGVESSSCFGQTGLERVFFFKGSRKACAVLDGSAVFRYPDKSVLLMRYKAGKLEGPSESLDPVGHKLLEENYVGGKMHGKKKEWYPENGPVKSEELYLNGRRNGTAVEWYPNGKLKRNALYKDGKLEGECQEFYDNEKKLRVSFFINGKWHGPFAEWYSDGKRFSEGSFKNGKAEKIRYFERNGAEIPDTFEPRAPASVPPGVQPAFFADFDANGFLDAVVPRPEQNNTQIVFLGAKGMIRSIRIEEMGLELYNARGGEGQFKEPPTARDGLVVWGKESGNSSVYLYDYDKEAFLKSDHASDVY